MATGADFETLYLLSPHQMINEKRNEYLLFLRDYKLSVDGKCIIATNGRNFWWVKENSREDWIDTCLRFYTAGEICELWEHTLEVSYLSHSEKIVKQRRS